MSLKREQKLFDIAKRFRNLKYRINNFYQYQVVMNYKHLLLVGDSNTELGQEIIKKFGDTWKIGSIGAKQNELCQFNYELEQFKPNQTKNSLDIEKIDEQMLTFSKHIDCVLFLPSSNLANVSISDEGIFDACEKYRRSNVEPALIASYIASKFLIPSGLVMYIGDNDCFCQPTPEKIPESLSQDQIGLMNLFIGDREHISVDSASYQLLLQDLKIDNQNTQIANYIKLWADGQKRPVSGTFIKFNSKEQFIYPELI